MFSYLYALLSGMYCQQLDQYLWGYDCTCQCRNLPDHHTFFDIWLLLTTIGIAAIYYFAINHPRWNHRWHWLLFLTLSVIINFAIGAYFTYDDLTNGNLNTPQTSCLLNQYDSNGNIIGQFIEVQDCLMFGLSNAIFAAVFFFIVSIGMKFGSRNCKYVPF